MRTSSSAIILLAAFAAASVAKADPKEMLYQRYLQRQAASKSKASATSTVQAATFKQKLDHTDAQDTRTFTQRYFYDLSNAGDNKAAPVLLYICGEARCSAGDLGGMVGELARQRKAVLVTLEHRYYGDSQPFQDMSANNLKFLSTGQALADLDAFQKWFTAQNQLTGPWVAVGGSYAGSLSAYYRALYPQNVKGSLSSSGPIHAKENFTEYDAQVANAAGSTCLANLLEVTKTVETEIADDARFLQIKTMFDAADIVDRMDFLYTVADTAAGAIQYGMKDRFCSLIANGDKLKGYATFAKEFFRAWGIRAVDMSFQKALDPKTSSHTDSIGMRQWTWQSCTEYGYWQISNVVTGGLTARSTKIDLPYHHEVCKRAFGLDGAAPTADTNDVFLTPALDADHIFFTNGSDDPWAKLSITDAEVQQNPNLEATTIVGGAHCDDLQNTVASRKAVARFKTLFDSWIK